MGILDRVNAIEMRMQEIQSMISSQQAMPPTAASMSAQGSFQAVMGGAMGEQFAPATPPTAYATPGGLPAIGLPGMFPGINVPAQPGMPPSGPTSTQYDAYIKEASQKWGVDESLVKAVIQQESSFNPNACSSCGAQGLMQLMPETARSLGVQNAYDPQQNIMGGTRYLRGLLDRFNGDPRLALAAYNAGAGSVQKYGGVPPFAETQNYVSRIMANYDRMKVSQD